MESRTLLSRYEVLESLGRGGMGEVFKARDLNLKRTVAIKELRRAALADEQIRGRFLREARLAAQLTHPHIATVHDVIEADGETFIVMEYIEGERLLDRVKREPLTPDEAYDYTIQIADALAQAHKNRIIHRDIKSANIMITPGGHCKVLDFGLAKQMESQHQSTTGETVTTMAEGLTMSMVTFGTPKYMSPEQRRTANVDERADIFSFGMVMCEMFAGDFDMAGVTLAEVLVASPHWPPMIQGVPENWQPIVRKALAKDVNLRYQTMDQLLADVKKLQLKAIARPTEMETLHKAMVRPEILPTVALSAVGIGSSLGLLHLAAGNSGEILGAVFLALALVSPRAIFFLRRFLGGRVEAVRKLLSAAHPYAESFTYLNLVIVLLASFSFFDLLGFHWLGDWRYQRWFAEEPASDDIVLVAIDEDTKNRLTRQPDGKLIDWPKEGLRPLRKYHPAVMDRIMKDGPKAIAFDLFFIDETQDDPSFAGAIKRARTANVPVVVGQNFDPQKQGFQDTAKDIKEALKIDDNFFALGHPIVLSGIRDDTVRIVPLYIRQLVANPDATPTLGQAEFQSISLWMASQGRYVGDTLNKGVELRIGNDAVPIDTSVRYVEGLQVEGYHYEYENLLVYYPNVFAYGPNDPFRKVSYADLADTNNKNIPSGFFKDKFVFIGAEIEMFDPIRRTPHGMWSPYKIHASALNTILRRSYIKRLPPMAGLLSIVIFTHLVLLLSMKVPPRSRTFLIATAGLCLLLFAAAYGLFKMAQYWFDSDYPILATAATGLLTYLRRP